jgi:hypothetical protein
MARYLSTIDDGRVDEHPMKTVAWQKKFFTAVSWLDTPGQFC